MCPPGGRRRRRAEIVLSPPGDGEVGWGSPGRGGRLRAERYRDPHGARRGGGRPRTSLTVQGQSGWRDGVQE